MVLCATLKKVTPRALAQANRQGDLIELSSHYQLRSLCQKPVIFKFHKIDWEALSYQPDYVDLPHTTENAVFEKIKRRYPHIQRICSYHDFEKSEALEALYSHLQSRPAEFYKIATYARSTLDALRMLAFVKKTGCIGVCMGELGAMTRILAPVVKAPWTYAPCSLEQQTASGQIVLKDLLNTYRFRALSSSTALYGLIGNPVETSMSHVVHNFAFKKLGIKALYVKMRLTADELSDFFPLCVELGFKGLSVTMPLKKAVAPYLHQTPFPAINTLRIDQGKIFGWNTDGVGALEALEKRIKVAQKTLLLIGAGGVAWAIAFEAKKRGAHLIIVNRTLSEGKRLAQEVQGEAYPLEKFAEVAQKGYDVLINCTPVGMGKDLHLPVASDALLENRVVMETISFPRQTPLLVAAKEKGCTLIEGGELFVQQAVGQYEHWFSR